VLNPGSSGTFGWEPLTPLGNTGPTKWGYIRPPTKFAKKNGSGADKKEGDEKVMQIWKNENVVEMNEAKRRLQKGVTTVEYAVMLVLVAIAVLAFGKGIANSVTDVFSNLASSLK
jgi:Flp pilus assembly pilin Flp